MATPNQQASQEEVKISLEDFNWDEPGTFFGQTVEGGDIGDYFSNPEPAQPPATPDPAKPATPATPDPDEELQEEVFFDEQGVAQVKKPADPAKPDESGSAEGNEGGDGNSEDNKFFKVFAGELKEKGILRNVEIPEDADVDEEGIYSAIDQEAEARATEMIEGLTESFEQDMKDFIQFRKAGGTAQAFLNNYFAAFTPELDMTNVAQQKIAVKQYLQMMGETDPEEIENQIQYLEDQGKLPKAAERYYGKLKEEDAANRAAILKAQEDAQAAAQKSKELFEANIKKALTEVNQIGDFSFAKVDKKELGEYITKATVKVGKNKFITPFQDAIGKLFQSEDKSELIILAKLLKSKFDTKDIVTKAATEKVAKTKSKLEEARSGGAARKNPLNNADITQFF